MDKQMISNDFEFREYFSGLIESNHKQLTTHLAIIAHQDDAEIVGYSGIQTCFQQPDQWFSSITLTNGSGASRGGRYQNTSDTELSIVRQAEQEKAAVLGEYAFCQQWLCSSHDLKTNIPDAVALLSKELNASRPSTIYTHSPFDKHSTHLSILDVVLQALTSIVQEDPDYQPTIYGVEVWGSLDWIPDKYRVELDCSPMPNLEQALIGLYDSQIDGNKGYDIALLGRRKANATFTTSHSEDTMRSVNLAIDLSPLVAQKISLKAFVNHILNDFSRETTQRLKEISSFS